MNFLIIILLICSFIFLVTLITFVIIFSVVKTPKYKDNFPQYMFNNSPYAPSGDNGFSGITISKLSQPKSFYSKHRAATLNYLSSVYPAGKSSLEQLDDLQLASFYNSLNFYYNCAFRSDGQNMGILAGVLGNKWDPLPCNKDYPLPYTPQGYIFNMYTYQKNNIPFVYSDSDMSKDNLKLENIGSCRPGLAFTTFKTGQYGGIRTGPGMFWVNCRTIERNVWYPNGFFNDKNKDVISSEDNWKIKIGQPITWNYPTGWLNGLPSNNFIEVTHFYPGPGGITTSPGWWYNGFCGTGLFINLGKTFRVPNKIGGVFLMAQQLGKTSYGREVLQKQFSTTDPYEIVWGFNGLNGYDKETGQKYCNFPIAPCKIGGGIDANKGIPAEAGLNLVQDFYGATVDYQKRKNISSSDIPTKDGIKAAIDAAVNMTDFNMYRFSVNIISDEPMFFFALNLGLDTVQLPVDPNSNGYFVFEVLDVRMPPKYMTQAKNRDYSQFINITDNSNNQNNTTGFANSWKKEFVTESINYLLDENILTLRDPLDIYNENKTLKCEGLRDGKCKNNLDEPGMWFNLFCDQNKLSKAYQCLLVNADVSKSKCNLTGDSPDC